MKQTPPVHLKVELTLPNREPREFSYDFQQPVISLGRDPGNDIQVPLTTVSRRHARIFFEVGDYFLEDLASTHGTEHNGRKVPAGEKRLLRDGDTIKIMSFHIQFKTTVGTMLDRKPGEKTEALARRMVQEVLASLGSNQADPPALRIMNGVDEGRRFELSEDSSEITIGRSPECDITLNDQNTSRRHCLIKRNWHGFTAQDLASKNGVLINGEQIEGAQMLKDGDELQVGGVKLIFIDPPSRLLDQMGGLEKTKHEPGPATDGLDPGDVPEPEAQDHEDHVPVPDAYSEPAPEPVNDGMELPPPDTGPPPAVDDAVDPELLAQVNNEIAKVTKKGVAWEVLILVFGGVFFLGALSFVAFLLM
ncbi:MAG: FHA domain-containing protein [Myxococcota bacterium]